MVQHGDERTLERWVREYEYDPEYVAEGLAIEVTEEAAKLLEERELTQSELARMMGVSRAHVSRVFNAPPNLTLLSIARLGVALKVKPRVVLDSDKYLIYSMSELVDYETFQTDRAIIRARRQNTADTTITESTRGALANATVP